MRLSKGEYLFVGLMIAIIWYLLFTVVHSKAHVHTLIWESEKKPSSLDPLWELYMLSSEEGVELTGWQVHWKKDVQPREKERLLHWLKEHPSFTLVKEEVAESPGQIQFKRALWQSQDDSTLHQVQLIDIPHQSGYLTKFSYTWSGQILEADWQEKHAQIETQFSKLFHEMPQNFTCLEGFTNDKLEFSLFKKQIRHWLTFLDGELREIIEDNHFISVTGYVPKWKNQHIAYGDKKLNLQLSARYNALERKTRLTLGYPLIMTEH